MSDAELVQPGDQLQLFGDNPGSADPHMADLRTLVGGMTGSEGLAAMDGATLRSLSTVLVERLMFARQAGITFHGARDLYEVLGYKRVLTYLDYRARYMRGGLAKRIVDAYPVAVWRAGAEVYEDEDTTEDTEFEAAWKSLEARLGVWSRFERTNKLALLSTYSVLLIGTADGDLTQELPRGNGTPDGIIYLTPFSGGGGPGGDQWSRSMAMAADASIQSFDTDTTSPRFGMPAFYFLKRVDLSSPVLQRNVHWSRIIHVADGLLGDEVYGSPAMESVWNLLDDLDKVTGGGAEAFWLRANAGLHLDVDKTMGFPTHQPGKQGAPGVTHDERKRLTEQAELLNHQLQRVMVTKGVTATQLSSAVANFKDPADAIVTQIAGTKAIPKRILVGSEMGQLASGQDKDNWDTQVQDKRTGWAFPTLVKALVDRLLQYNYLPPLKKKDTFYVDWPVIEDLTEDEKAKYALDLANVNKAYGSTVFTDDEIRQKAYGMEPVKDTTDDQFRAELAVKLTLANKQQGITVFTDDEIRKVAYGWDPLQADQKVPIGAPEKISVAKPPPIGADGVDVPAPGTAEDIANKAQMKANLKALEGAIRRRDLATIDRLLGITKPVAFDLPLSGGVQ